MLGGVRGPGRELCRTLLLPDAAGKGVEFSWNLANAAQILQAIPDAIGKYTYLREL